MPVASVASALKRLPSASSEPPHTQALRGSLIAHQQWHFLMPPILGKTNPPANSWASFPHAYGSHFQVGLVSPSFRLLCGGSRGVAGVRARGILPMILPRRAVVVCCRGSWRMRAAGLRGRGTGTSLAVRPFLCAPLPHAHVPHARWHRTEPALMAFWHWNYRRQCGCQKPAAAAGTTHPAPYQRRQCTPGPAMIALIFAGA